MVNIEIFTSILLLVIAIILLDIAFSKNQQYKYTLLAISITNLVVACINIIVYANN